MAFVISLVATLGRPPFLPLALALFSPSFVRSNVVFLSSVVVNDSLYENQKALDMQKTLVFLD